MKKPLQQEPYLDYVELSPTLTDLEWQALPHGRICDWIGPSSRHQLTTLHRLVTTINAPVAAHSPRGRCAIIDVAHQLNSPIWKLLTASGVNWLVRPDDLYAALQSALMLLISQQFSLVALPGLSIEDLHPEDALLLQSAVSPQTTLLFLQNIPWDNSGEPVPLDRHPMDRQHRCA